jgi:tetratricopeptide (TPR) repeat protein
MASSAGTAELSAQLLKIKESMEAHRYDAAATELEKVIPQLPTSLKANSYSDLAVCYKNQCALGRAYDAFDAALRYSVKGVAREKILLNYSNLLIEAGDYDAAIRQLAEVTTPSLLPYKLINLSNATYFLDTANLPRSVALLDSCLAIPALPDQWRRIALQNKGFYYADQRDYKTAVEYFDASLQGETEKTEYYRTKGNIAIAKAHLGDYQTAKKDIKAACRWFVNRSDIDYRIALRKAGEVYLLANERATARDYLRDYFHHEQRSLIASLPTLSKGARLNLWVKEKELLSHCFMMEDYDAELLYEVALFRRQTSLLGMHDIADLKATLTVKPQAVRKALHANEAAVEFVTYTDISGVEWYAAIILPKVGAAKFVKLFTVADVYKPAKVGERSLFDAIKEESPESKNRLYGDTILGNRFWRPILDVLPRRTAAIYFAPEGVLHFWGVENMPFDGAERVALHRVSATASLTQRREATSEKDILLVGGLDYSKVPPEKTTKYPDHEASQLLINQLGKTELFNYLPGTQEEVDSIKTLLTDATLCHEMGETRLKEVMPQYSIIHIATHGYSLSLGIRKRPGFMADSLAIDRSLNAAGLALTGANVSSRNMELDDGVLSAREICDLDLTGVDFVVLSACQTAQGDITDEGAAGLIRGLKNAGVKTILATLWSVNDISTAAFMKAFYEQLAMGATRYDAFRYAQNYLKTVAVNSYYHKFSPMTLARERKLSVRELDMSDPFYWAPFILIDAFE